MAISFGKLACQEIGVLETSQIEWKINDFFSVVEDQKFYRYASPTFSFAKVQWHLRLWPRWTDTSEFMSLYLLRSEKQGIAIEYNFGLKKLDDSVEQFVNGVLKPNESCSDEVFFIRKSDLLERKSEFVPCNILTVTCALKVINTTPYSFQPSLLDKAKSLKLIKLEKLSENFKDLFHDKESCDVILKVQGSEYKAHKSVLIARSNIFAANFRHDTLERQTGVIIIPDCDPDSFQVFLEYLYCGKLEEFSFPSALNLYYTSDKYGIDELKAFCIEYLMQSLTVENICEVAVFADKYEEIQLFSIVQDFFNNNVCKISETAEWEYLMQNDCILANKLLKEMLKVKTVKN